MHTNGLYKTLRMLLMHMTFKPNSLYICFFGKLLLSLFARIMCGTKALWGLHCGMWSRLTHPYDGGRLCIEVWYLYIEVGNF